MGFFFRLKLQAQNNFVVLLITIFGKLYRQTWGLKTSGTQDQGNSDRDLVNAEPALTDMVSSGNTARICADSASGNTRKILDSRSLIKPSCTMFVQECKSVLNVIRKCHVLKIK